MKIIKILGTMIREQDPLKQGLKRFLRSIVFRSVIIREQDPLKQGLKPYKITILQ